MEIWNTVISGVVTATLVGTGSLVVHLFQKKHGTFHTTCNWHKLNTERLMWAMDAVLDYVERDASVKGVQLNGRFARGREGVESFIKENDELKKVI